MYIPSFTIPPALRNRRFTILWLGLMISITGSQMQLWALFWHIRTLSDQPLAVSGIGLARFLPILILSLFAGLVADRFNRRKVVFITQSVMTLVALLLGLLTRFGHIQLWQIYLLTGIQAAAVSFDGPARQSLVPNIVAREDLPSAFSMQSIGMHTGAIVGPALSGLVISTLGQEWTYWINAVSFGSLFIALILIGPVPQAVTNNYEGNGKRLQWSAIQEGIRYILSQPIILGSMVLDFFASFFSSANTLLPYVAQDVLHVGAVQYGWLSAAQSIGSVGVAFIISQKRKMRHQGLAMLIAVCTFGLGTVVFGLSRVFWLTMLALVVVGASDTVSVIIRQTVRQLVTPDAMRGRMISINQIFVVGGPQLGEIESGIVAQLFNTPVAILTGGIGCLVATAVVALRWPQLRKYDRAEG